MGDEPMVFFYGDESGTNGEGDYVLSGGRQRRQAPKRALGWQLQGKRSKILNIQRVDKSLFVGYTLHSASPYRLWFSPAQLSWMLAAPRILNNDADQIPG